MTDPFVPADFDPPTSLVTERFRLEPLGPEHNASDLAAWSSSIAHIRATPGVGSSRVDLQACKLEYSIVSPK